jgi:aldehyde:ferredoxin oxidoreductase
MSQTMWGYMGKVLRVDLSNGRCWDEPLDPALAESYLGGQDSG